MNNYIDLPEEGGGSAGVSSLNGLTGALTLVAGSGITITPSGSSLTIASTGSSGVASVTASSPLFSSGGANPNLTIQVANSTENGYLSSTDWNTFDSKMGNIGQIALQNVYVAIGGSDVTGDGSLGNPYASINHALSTITDAGTSQNGSEKRYSIQVAAGAYNETQILLKPWIYIEGTGYESTYVRVNGGSGSVGVDPSATGAARMGMSNIYLGGGTSVDIDLHTLGPNTGTPSADVTFQSVTVTGSFTMTGRAPGIDYLEMYDNFIFNGFSVTDVLLGPFQGVVFNSTASINAANNTNTSGVDGDINNCFFGGAVTMSNTSAEPLNMQINSSSMQSTLVTTGTVALEVDGISMPLRTNQSLSGGTTVTYTSDTMDIGYSPVTPANWPIVPATAQQGLDDLASRLSSSGTVTSVALADATGTFAVSGSPVTTSGTLTLLSFNSQAANTVLAAPNGSAGAPSFRLLVSGDIPNNAANTTGTASNVTGTVAIANGGTGQTTAANAINALLPSQTGNAGDVLTTNGTVASWAAASGGGITQLTGDVTAGPGSGSQASTVAKIQGTTVSGTTGTTNVVFSASPTLTGTALATNLTMTGTLTVPTIVSTPGAGVTLSLTGGTAASSGNGGQVTINGANGSSVTTGGNGGTVTISGGAANGTNNNTGGAVNLQAGQSVESGTGGTVTISSGTGGTGSGTAGATGGTTNVNGGTGGAGSSTSGNGGGINIKAGSGGGGVAGGQGGQAELAGGTGGTGSASGGSGGAALVQGGSPGSVAGAAGGNVTIAAGNGTSTGSGGNGGTMTISSGTANGDNTVSNTGGSMSISVGHSMGSASGSQITMTAGTGGVGTGTAGANGGNTVINAGNGGIGSSTGGNGGALQFNAGTGGNSGTPGTGGIIQFFTASTTSLIEKLRVLTTGVNVMNGPLGIITAGNGLQIAHGSNCKLGTTALTAGSATVSNTVVTANSLIFLTSQADGGTPGFVRVTAKTAGTSFVITSSSSTDTSTIAWLIVEGL